jgi:hypothetical protein
MPTADPGPDPGELRARTADLADAEARYHSTLDEPEAAEADRIEAADNLGRAKTRIRELTAAEAEEADAELEAQRQAWGPEWPYWLSSNNIDFPEADLF